MGLIRKHLPEQIELESLIEHHSKAMTVKTLATIPFRDHQFPIYAIEMGSQAPDCPTFVLTGGVHGLERIGSRVVLAYLKTLLTYTKWDESVSSFLSKVRLAFIPMVNPVGMYLNRRANGNGVDLMRNSPVEADQSHASFLIGGHRISPNLPWYRGQANGPMEIESKVVTDYIQSFIAHSKVSLLLDVHSGFGIMDRLWFPYAKSRIPFPNLKEMYALNELLDETLPNHIYKVEPQSLVYTTHGDLWDYIYDNHRAKNPDSVFIPLTLELGSWLWIKKNPRQLFSSLGIFNPLIPHRLKRILRRHLNLIDFLTRAVGSHSAWTEVALKKEITLANEALKRWYQAA